MLVIGLTGGIGSGKSTVARLFSELNVPIIDADIVAREVVLPGTKALDKIVEHFGKDILSIDGTLNRQKLSDIIFSAPEERLWLENLLHPIIRAKMREQIRQIRAPYCILVIPLIAETRPDDLFSRVLVVSCSKQAQIDRVKQRDNFPEDKINAILSQQASNEEREKLADDIINNNSDLESLKAAVSQLHMRYLSISQ